MKAPKARRSVRCPISVSSLQLAGDQRLRLAHHAVNNHGRRQDIVYEAHGLASEKAGILDVTGSQRLPIASFLARQIVGLRQLFLASVPVERKARLERTRREWPRPIDAPGNVCDLET
ncbi:hypothetical protein [Variovorax sp. dw_954]|uniref:hypothetical protein n=1 Tax=Variovorax sp. dw_954 TaxID=2720078 RepID=UPI001BD46318|nr:hypothetical protein [Variovorax sp. dw_954]